MCLSEGEVELASSLHAKSFRGVMNLCSERCPEVGLLLELFGAFAGGITKRGGVGLVRYLLGGVKDSCKTGDRLANASGSA